MRSLRISVQPAGALRLVFRLTVTWASSRSPDIAPAGTGMASVEPALLEAEEAERKVIVVGGGGGGPPPHEGKRKEPTRVRQGAEPVVERYSFVYQKVQSSAGSTLIEL